MRELNTLDMLPGSKAQKESIKSLIQEYDLDLDGYLSWLAESQGPCLLAQKAAQSSNATLYKKTCTQEASSLPRHIVNAGTLYEQLTSNALGSEDALAHLKEMCLPVAVYLLFSAEGFEIPDLKDKAKAYCKMFPSAVKSLPEPYNEIGKALIDDST